MARAKVGDIELDYEIIGDGQGPAFLLLRGMGSQRIRWDADFLSGLAEAGLRVVTVDNRDAGGSTYLDQLAVPSMPEFMGATMRGEPFDAPYRLDDMAGDIIGLMNVLGIERAFLMGLSMGGHIIQVLAATHPERVLGYISFASSHELPGLHKVAPEVMAVMQAGPQGTDEASLVEYELDNCRAQAGSTFPIDDDRYRAILREERRRGIANGGDTRQIMAILATGDRTETCRRITVPTLIIHGSADPLVPLAEAEAMAQLIPGAELKVIEGAGHDLTPGLVPIVLPAVVDFCRRHAPA